MGFYEAIDILLEIASPCTEEHREAIERIDAFSMGTKPEMD